LEQTKFQIPHWFTEGLAVINEGYPRPPEWNRLLPRRLAANKLLNLDNINIGFQHPKSPEEWNLAYLQSLLYVEYMKAKFGPKTVSELLDAFRRGLDTTSAIREVCKVDKAAFEKGYRTYLEGVVKEIKGKATKPLLSYDAVQKALKQKPGDPDLTAQLAYHYLEGGEKKEARQLAKQVLDKKKTHPLASYVKARLLLDAGEEDQALALLKAALDRDDPELKVVGLLGKVYFESKKFTKA